MLGIAKSPFQIRQHQTPTHRIAKVITIHRFTRAHGGFQGAIDTRNTFWRGAPDRATFRGRVSFISSWQAQPLLFCEKKKKRGGGRKKKLRRANKSDFNRKVFHTMAVPRFLMICGGKKWPLLFNGAPPKRPLYPLANIHGNKRKCFANWR